MSNAEIASLCRTINTLFVFIFVSLFAHYYEVVLSKTPQKPDFAVPCMHVSIVFALMKHLLSVTFYSNSNSISISKTHHSKLKPKDF